MDIRNKIKNFLYKHSLGFTFLKISLAVNIINTCNRSCSFCAYHGDNLPENYHNLWYGKQPIQLKYDRFEAFIRHLGVFRHLIRSIAITGKGEPMLHPDLLKYCLLCEKYRIPFSITTNGDREKNVYKILGLKYLTGIRVSIYDIKVYYKWKYMYHPKISFFNQTGKPINGVPDGWLAQTLE